MQDRGVTEMTMTQVYFHCATARGLLRDRRGSEVADLIEACERATQIARRLIATPGPEDWRRWVLHVTDQDGEEVFALPFSSLLGKPN
jgi:hypothetical protein